MRDDLYVLNHCTVRLARSKSDERHNFGYGHHADGDPSGRIPDAWWSPVIASYADPPDGLPAGEFNDVRFVYPAFDEAPGSVGVVGTFAKLYQPVALRRVQFLGEDTAYFAVTVPVRRRAVFVYKFLVDGRIVLDPISPQR